MKIIIIIILIAAILAGLSVINYRRFYPKAKSFSGSRTAAKIQKLTVISDEHKLYGQLITPKQYTGKLPTVICSHGFNGSYRYFRNYVGKSLAMSGFAVYCFDFYAGSEHGKSRGSMQEMSIFAEKDQLNNVISKIKTLDCVDTEHLFLFGESQGGFVTAAAAAEHVDDVRAIVLYYPAFCAADDIKKRYRSLDEMPDVIDVMGKKVGKIYYEKLFDYDAYKEIRKYTGPVLIVHGDADRTVNVSYGEKAARAYQNAQFEILHGQDHGFDAKGKVKAGELAYRFLKKQCERRWANGDSENKGTGQ